MSLGFETIHDLIIDMHATKTLGDEILAGFVLVLIQRLGLLPSWGQFFCLGSGISMREDGLFKLYIIYVYVKRNIRL